MYIGSFSEDGGLSNVGNHIAGDTLLEIYDIKAMANKVGFHLPYCTVFNTTVARMICMLYLLSEHLKNSILFIALNLN